ncbi:sigma-54-dependent transcriptional regulator [Thioalkalivibrio sp.]|uniref:sigma-54-dependent transcriptional regulator n=1 Tax=Thioalkalivibrio sp. TaxID=2093813 RepID=UPI00397653A7
MVQDSILIVDDDRMTRETLSRALSDSYATLTAGSGEEALELLQSEPVSIVLADLVMPGMNGMELLEAINKLEYRPMVILITGQGTVDSAVEAMKLGAYDYLPKPINIDRLDVLILKALEALKLRDENLQLKRKFAERYSDVAIVGQSPEIRQLLAQVEQVASTNATVLIEGESGTGKEMIANIIHFNSDRALGPFVKVNCAAFSEGVVESELFGHERGSFTGALATKKGRFELADGGTLLIDEVGDLPPSVQVKILRFLQERTFQRVGGHRDLKVDVRIVSATNRKLEELVAEGSFREDLYYRLCVVRLKIPPLRERRQDIDIMCEHFLRHYSETHNRDIDGISDEVRELMRKHSWPGNVRELMNCVESMVVTATGRLITLDNLPEHLLSKCAAMQIEPETGGTLAAMERQMIAETLEHTGGDKPEAARILGIGLRTLYRKIERWGL